MLLHLVGGNGSETKVLSRMSGRTDGGRTRGRMTGGRMAVVYRDKPRQARGHDAVRPSCFPCFGISRHREGAAGLIYLVLPFPPFSLPSFLSPPFFLLSPLPPFLPPFSPLFGSPPPIPLQEIYPSRSTYSFTDTSTHLTNLPLCSPTTPSLPMTPFAAAGCRRPAPGCEGGGAGGACTTRSTSTQPQPAKGVPGWATQVPVGKPQSRPVPGARGCRATQDQGY
ncbi:hypothetical protein GGS23DRAFT_456182 [Durotheca rogersii]|uniref:uncharacterized protein n=1 Tax=Durotheca rogersii TaxID=419775 RepID=UPI002220E4AA|nr:uncharacterized protein GGS23DRAFT_456182 [Durotheca rogersii]KAI5864612.1 hypothetical protein GGS23DRAFT_456182 [Durotheca rogersii]